MVLILKNLSTSEESGIYCREVKFSDIIKTTIWRKQLSRLFWRWGAKA